VVVTANLAVVSFYAAEGFVTDLSGQSPNAANDNGFIPD
jgi:hypothetical protein